MSWNLGKIMSNEAISGFPLVNDSEPPPGDGVRRLIRACDRASLGTALADGGWPYASLVLTACDPGAAPILLISDLADHTRNIAADPRISLLYDGTAGLAEPLAGARATVLGRAERSDDPALRARYLARHPGAAIYADFADFGIYRVTVERAHLVAGFGRIDWVEAGEVLYDGPAGPDLAEAEAGICAHMNEDHADALDLYANRLLGLDGGGWRMTGIDAEGLDLRRQGAVGRLDFEVPLNAARDARELLVRLVQAARK